MMTNHQKPDPPLQQQNNVDQADASDQDNVLRTNDIVAAQASASNCLVAAMAHNSNKALDYATTRHHGGA
jgi:hypothetical protein